MSVREDGQGAREGRGNLEEGGRNILELWSQLNVSRNDNNSIDIFKAN